MVPEVKKHVECICAGLLQLEFHLAFFQSEARHAPPDFLQVDFFTS